MGYNFVDGTKLNNDLTSIANTIREKTGTTEQLVFPTGFNDAINNISTGTKPEQEKTVSVSENGTVTVVPDSGNVLSRVTVTVNIPNGHIETVEYSVTIPQSGGVAYINENGEYCEITSGSNKKIKVIKNSIMAIAVEHKGTHITITGVQGIEGFNNFNRIYRAVSNGIINTGYSHSGGAN